MINLKKMSSAVLVMLLSLTFSAAAMASEIDLKVPSLDVMYNIFGWNVTGSQILLWHGNLCFRNDFWIG